jgi:hypothetical protein
MKKEEKILKEKEYNKQYYEKNKLKFKERKKLWYLNNKEKVADYNREYTSDKINSETIKKTKVKYNKNNKEKLNKKSLEYYKINKNNNKLKDYQKEYYNKNKDILKVKKKEYRNKNKEKINLYVRNKRKQNNLIKLSGNLRSLINNAFKNKGYRKNSKTEKILGCSFEEFKCYLESKFEFWMSWDNYGLYNGQFNYGWDIDHIIPLSSADNEIELTKLNHFTNLRPFCSYNNRNIKRNNI